MKTTQTHPAPFLSWVGGKGRLLPTLTAALPRDLDLTKHRYFELFAGGASLMWALARHPSAANVPNKGKGSQPIVLNDANTELITTYRTVRNDCGALVEALRNLTQDVSEERFYQVREWQPEEPVDVAARFIYLNGTTYHGLYRVNQQGKFNAPYGHRKNPKVWEENKLYACSRWLQHAALRNTPFSSAVNDVREGDVVYLDPPYVPLSPTAAFTSYTSNGFGEFDHWALAGLVRGLVHRGARVMLSNSNTPLVHEVFGKEVDLHVVSVRRSVAATSKGRGMVEEVLGLSYPATECDTPELFTSSSPTNRDTQVA